MSDSDGLIALTGGPAGPIDRALRAGLGDLAESRLKRLAEAFGSRLYVEIQRHGLDSERAIEPALIGLADRARLAPGRDQRALFRLRLRLRGA